MITAPAPPIRLRNGGSLRLHGPRPTEAAFAVLAGAVAVAVLARAVACWARTVACWAGVVACLAPAAALAQNQRFPGVPGGDGFSAAAARAEYYADVMFHTNELMTDWRRFWAADDVEELLELYTEDATLVYAGERPVRGREAIREQLDSLLRVSGEVQASLSDFDASGRMGLVSGLLTLSMSDGRRSWTATGLHMTVLIRRGRHWRIRSQLVRLDSALDAPPSPSGLLPGLSGRPPGDGPPGGPGRPGGFQL